MANKKILFLSFYGFRTYIQDIKDEFERKLYRVDDIPYMILKNNHNKTDDDIADIVVNTVTESYKTDTIINSIFMFLLPANVDFLKTISNKINNKLTKIIFYNFDDPISTNLSIINYSKNIDLFFTQNIYTLNCIKPLLNVNKLIHLPLFLTLDADITKFKSKDNKNITNDICILYDADFSKVYNVTEIIKSIKITSLDYNQSIKLYGPRSLETIYADIYEGEYTSETIHSNCSDSKVILYLKSNMFPNKKIDMVLVELMLNSNLCIMPYSKNTNHLIKANYTCLLLDNVLKDSTYLPSIVNDYPKYKSLEKNSYINIKKNYSISKWVDTIISYIE